MGNTEKIKQNWRERSISIVSPITSSLGEIDKKESYPRIGHLLTLQISSKKDPSLFDTLNDTQRTDLINTDRALYIDRRNKPIALTNKETRLVFALSYLITQQLEEDDIKEYMDRLQAKLPPKGDLYRFINIEGMSRLLNNGSARGREREELVKNFKKLSEIKQVQKIRIGGSKGEEITRVRPLLSITGEDLDENGEVISLRVTFSPLFFNEVRDRYTLIPRELFQVWGKKGNGTGTDLFSTLVSDLYGKYFQYITRARATRSHILKTKYEYKQTPEELEERIAKETEKALIYEELTATIRSKVPTDYESNRKMRRNFIPDLEKAINALVELGIITDKSFISESKEKVYFFFNANYGTKKSNRLLK